MADGQTLSLYDIDPSTYPIIRAKVLALDADGSPYRPNINDLELFEDGTKRTIRSITCPEPKPIVPISSVLTLDISSSMREHADRNLEIARAAARAWIEGMPLGVSECAITSFNLGSFLNQDFTIDSRKLLSAVDDLRPDGGTSYDAALISPVTGAVPVALGGKHKRVIVFLTDGRGNGNEAEIVRQAKAGDITIHCVTVGLPAPAILKSVATRTGGLWFENVTTPEEAAKIYRLILGQAQGGEPCEIEWESGPTCDPERIVTLTDRALPGEATTTYTAPPQAIADLTVSTTEIRFATVAPNSTDRKTITLSTGNTPVRVLSITSSDPRIKAVANNAPPVYTIPANAAYDVIFEYAPTDSSFVYAEITIQIDGCTKTVYAAGGRWRNGSAPPEIRLVVPNGGERFPVGSNTTIEWTGVLPTDTVMLEYSTDAGTTWDTITQTATGLKHAWHVEDRPSETCLARVTVDSFGTENNNSPFAKRLYTYSEHENFGSITAARFSPDGKFVATGSNHYLDKVRIWNTLDGTPHNSLTPLGRVLDIDFNNDGSRLAVATDVAGSEAQIFSFVGGPTISISEPGLTAIALSKDGGQSVATGTSAGNVNIWNGSDGTLRTSIRQGTLNLGSITSIDFSPTTNELVIVGAGNGIDGIPDTIKIYNDQGQQQWYLPRRAGVVTHTAGIMSARYSDDGQKIATAASDGVPYVWPNKGSSSTSTLVGHNDAAFSPDGTRVVVGDGDSTRSNVPGIARILDASNESVVGSLVGHTKAVTSVDMTELNSREYIVTAGPDRTAIIWEIGSKDSSATSTGSDISDNLWAIVDAKIEAPNVDFGDVLVGSSKDSVVVGYIKNSGSVEIEVNELRISGSDLSAFDMISGLPPFTVPTGESREVELRFTPNTARRFNATLEIFSNVDTLAPLLSGDGVHPQLRIDATVIDFGLVEVGDQKDSLVQVVVSNVGGVPLTISSTQQDGPDHTSFFILSGKAPFILAPGESHAMLLRFAPTVSGRTNGTIQFGYNGPGSPATVILFGEGFCPTTITRAHATVGDIAGAPGDKVALPFNIVSLDPPPPSQPGISFAPLDFRATFAFNSSLLTPVDQTAIVEERLLERIASWEGRWHPLDSSITWVNGEPTFVAGLGNAESTPVRIDDITWSQGCPPDVAKSDGMFVLHELCRDGGTRLFSTDGQLKLGKATPNPALSETTIRFALIEEGVTRLYVVDMGGERIATIADDVMIPGSYTATLNVSTLGQGNYILVLETPTAQLTTTMFVRK